MASIVDGRPARDPDERSAGPGAVEIPGGQERLLLSALKTARNPRQSACYDLQSACNQS
jgi:hypothetical protein